MASGDSDDRPLLAAIAVVASTTFALLAVWARLASPVQWELGLVISLSLGADPLAELVRTLSFVGDLPVWAVLVAAASLAARLVSGALTALAVAATFASDLVALVVKVLVERSRPDTAAVEHLFGGESFAYPSGHVVRAVAFVGVIVWLAAPPRWRLRAALGAAVAAGLVMGYARVALGVHWPTDALGGVLLGLAWFALTASVLSGAFAGRRRAGNRIIGRSH